MIANRFTLKNYWLFSSIVFQELEIQQECSIILQLSSETKSNDSAINLKKICSVSRLYYIEVFVLCDLIEPLEGRMLIFLLVLATESSELQTIYM